MGNSQRVSAFELCPPEICHRIFQFACLDDGSAGISLSLVSRYLRDVSAPYRLHSVSVRSLEQAEMLARTLKRLPARHRRIVHLFFVCNFKPVISMDTTAVKSSAAIERIRSALPLLFWPSSLKRRRRDPTFEDTERLLHKELCRILELSSESLINLVIHAQRAPAHRYNHSLPNLPALEELTIAYPSQSQWRHNVTSTLHLFKPLPVLKYLVLDWFHGHPLALVTEVARVAPAVINIRLPWEIRDGASLQDEMKLAVLDEGATQALPSTVRRIYLPTLAFTSACHEIEAADCRIVVILGKIQNVLDIEAMWKDRINDGNGCWKVERIRKLPRRIQSSLVVV